MDRNEKGQWVKGQSGFAGRKKSDSASTGKGEYRRGVFAAGRSILNEAQWKKIIRRAISDAIRGNAEARRWLSEYFLGKPIQMTEITLGTPGEVTHDEVMEALKAEYLASAQDRRAELESD